jgi:hypothetical protein
MKEQYAANGDTDNPFQKIDFTPTTGVALNEPCHNEDSLREKIDPKPLSIKQTDWDAQKTVSPLDLKRQVIPPRSPMVSAKLFSAKRGNSKVESRLACDDGKKNDSSADVLQCLERAVPTQSETSGNLPGPTTTREAQQIPIENTRKANEALLSGDDISQKRRRIS